MTRLISPALMGELLNWDIVSVDPVYRADEDEVFWWRNETSVEHNPYELRVWFRGYVSVSLLPYRTMNDLENSLFRDTLPRVSAWVITNRFTDEFVVSNDTVDEWQRDRR